MLKISVEKQNKFGLLAVAILLVLASAPPAAAEARDQVVANATRCSVIGDDRQWLDCYYGAAQPVRAELRLKSATDAQLNLVGSPPAGRPAPEAQTVRNNVLRNAFGCSTDQEQRSWLNCFYAAAEPMRIRLGLARVLAPSTPPPPATAAFGLDKPIAKPAKVQGVTARMASYTFDKSGIFTVTLQNGQVWRQLASDDSFAHWHASADKYLVRISKGFWGSYNLEVPNQSGLYKVRRVN